MTATGAALVGLLLICAILAWRVCRLEQAIKRHEEAWQVTIRNFKDIADLFVTTNKRIDATEKRHDGTT